MKKRWKESNSHYDECFWLEDNWSSLIFHYFCNCYVIIVIKTIICLHLFNLSFLICQTSFWTILWCYGHVFHDTFSLSLRNMLLYVCRLWYDLYVDSKKLHSEYNRKDYQSILKDKTGEHPEGRDAERGCGKGRSFCALSPLLAVYQPEALGTQSF